MAYTRELEARLTERLTRVVRDVLVRNLMTEMTMPV